MENRFGLEEIKKAAELFLQLDDYNVIDVVLAVYAANRLDADPLWLFVVGAPGTAKTEILCSMNGHPGTFLLSSLTPRTFISGHIPTSEKMVKASLLFGLKNKVVIMKDFTTVLTLHQDHKSEIFSQLREIYDGRYSKAFGTGMTIAWEGKVGVLAGVTPAIDKQMAVNQLLGERFLYYRMENKNYIDAARMAIERTTGNEQYRKYFQQVVQQFLTELNSIAPSWVVEQGGFKENLINLATLCTHARSAVLRSRDQTLQSMQEPEGPARMVKQLSLLAKALAIVRGQNNVDQQIYEIVKRVALDSLPRLRLKVLQTLWQMFAERLGNSGGTWPWFYTREIVDRSGMPLSTVKFTLEDLMLLNLVRREVAAGGTKAHIWQPSNRLYEWALQSQSFITY